MHEFEIFNKGFKFWNSCGCPISVSFQSSDFSQGWLQGQKVSCFRRANPQEETFAYFSRQVLLICSQKGWLTAEPILLWSNLKWSCEAGHLLEGHQNDKPSAYMLASLTSLLLQSSWEQEDDSNSSSVQCFWKEKRGKAARARPSFPASLVLTKHHVGKDRQHRNTCHPFQRRD